MTRRTVRLIYIAILVVGLVAGGVVGCAAPREVIKEVPKEVIKEVPMNLPATADAIYKGEIDVGKEYGLALEQRYHKIHTTVLGLECTACHYLAKVDDTNKVSSAWNVSPQAPGPVDRRGCLGCHNAGPGSDLYGSSEP